MKEIISVFLGGGVGSILRYAVQMMMHERIVAYNFPWATFTVNIVGSFLIGLFYALSAKFDFPAGVRLFLTAGLCGGFTTFSTFSNDNMEMLRQGNGLICMLYIIFSLSLGICSCFAAVSLCNKL